MDDEIRELSLLLLYLTSWKEDEFYVEMQRSWKRYPFDILDTLNEAGFIKDSKRAKSVYLTEQGIEEAKKLAKKYQVEEESDD